MGKQILFFLLTATVMSAFGQASGNFNGMSISTGNLHPEASNYGVNLQNEMIEVREFDSIIKYDVVYELKNTTASFCTVTASIPLKIYFNEFAYGKRSPLLDQLATISTFSDIFTVQDRALDTRDQIRQNFQQRLFVRKYISVDNLKSMGIYLDLFRNNTRINIKKIFCEIRFMDETPLLLAKNTEVLSLDIKFMVDLNFTPDEQTTVMAFLSMPNMEAGIDRQETYTSYQLGYDKNWAGNINAFYIDHDLFSTTPILPSKFSNYKSMMSGERNQVLIFKDMALVDKDMLAFYHISGIKSCSNGNYYDEQLVIPNGVKNITSSSWVKTDLDLPKRSFMTTPQIAFSDSIQLYQTGNPTGIDVLSRNLNPVNYANGGLYNYVSENCKSNQSNINLKESGNAIYAFDIADHKFDDSIYTGVENLARQTCWCEGVAGSGANEYIEFELTQPARAIKIMNGNLLTRKIFDESTKADIIVITSLDGKILNRAENKPEYKSSIIDLPILNVYELNMPAGRYRLTMQGVDKGAVPVTCFSSITFDYIVDDEWYSKATAILSSFFGKVN